jgi:hypothetical protein
VVVVGVGRGGCVGVDVFSSGPGVDVGCGREVGLGLVDPGKEGVDGASGADGASGEPGEEGAEGDEGAVWANVTGRFPKNRDKTNKRVIIFFIKFQIKIIIVINVITFIIVICLYSVWL